MSTSQQTRPAVGTLYLDLATGDVYRLRDYGIDWQAEPFTGEATIPSYSLSLGRGGNTTADDLPSGAIIVWEPEADQPTGGLPLPNETLSLPDGSTGTVIASVVDNDTDFDEVKGIALMLTRTPGEFYALVHTSGRAVENIIGHYPNIVPAVAAYEANGGDY